MKNWFILYDAHRMPKNLGTEISSLFISPVVKQHTEEMCLKFYFAYIGDVSETFSLNIFTRFEGQNIENKNPIVSITQAVYNEWMPILVPLAASEDDFEVPDNNVNKFLFN